MNKNESVLTKQMHTIYESEMDSMTGCKTETCYNVMGSTVSTIPAKSKQPRYRNIKQCFCEIKKIDNDTAITEWFIRKLCKDNKIDYKPSGNKSLVNFDSLLEYLGYSEAV